MCPKIQVFLSGRGVVQGWGLLLEAGSALGPDQIALSIQVFKTSMFHHQFDIITVFFTVYLFLQAFSPVKPHRPLSASVKLPLFTRTLEKFSFRDVFHFLFGEFPCCGLFLTVHLRVRPSITKQKSIAKPLVGFP